MKSDKIISQEDYITASLKTSELVCEVLKKKLQFSVTENSEFNPEVLAKIQNCNYKLEEAIKALDK